MPADEVGWVRTTYQSVRHLGNGGLQLTPADLGATLIGNDPTTGAQLALHPGLVATSSQPLDLEELDAALERLTLVDPELARVVEVRFFGGLSIEEAAEALGISPATASLYLIPMSVGALLASVSSSLIVPWIGARMTTVLSTLLGIAAYVMLMAAHGSALAIIGASELGR